MPPRTVGEGQRLIEVICCDAGPVLTLESTRRERRCSSCGSAGIDRRRVTLGPGGELPPQDEWERVDA